MIINNNIKNKMSQDILEKINQAITEDRFIRRIYLGYTSSNNKDYLCIDNDVGLFMNKHYPLLKYKLVNDHSYMRWIVLSNTECPFKDCIK